METGSETVPETTATSETKGVARNLTGEFDTNWEQIIITFSDIPCSEDSGAWKRVDCSTRVSASSDGVERKDKKTRKNA